MNPRTHLPSELMELAATRQGVVCRSELLAAGLSRHSINRMASSWHHLGPGVFATDPRADPWLAKVHAGLLLGGVGSAAWGASAVALWGLCERPDVIEILTPTRRVTSAPWLRFHRRTRQLRRIVHRSPARVNLDDAVIDAVAGGSEIEALALVSRVLQERRTTPGRLREVLRGRSRVRHRGLLELAIGEPADGAHSALEHLFFRNVARPHRLAPLVRQYVVPQTGHPSDLASPDDCLLIELDGVRYHDPDSDRALDNRHATYGYITLRFTWADIIRDPCLVARTIGAFAGIAFQPCGSCRE